MLTGWQVLSPAYGQDYKSGKDARVAFLAGKDFVLEPRSQVCSIRDFSPGAQAEIRFNKLQKLVVVTT